MHWDHYRCCSHPPRAQIVAFAISAASPGDEAPLASAGSGATASPNAKPSAQSEAFRVVDFNMETSGD